VTRGDRAWLAADLLVAAALVGFLGYCVFNNGDLQLNDKAMQVREATYPLGLLFAPVGYLVARRRRRRRGVPLTGGFDEVVGGTLGPLRYPHLVAMLLTLPLVIDLAGNVFDWYDSIEHFDDWVHFGNPILIMVAGVVVLGSTRAPRWSVAVMSFALGCSLSMFWELIEGGVLERIAGVRLGLTQADTVSDMANGLAGAIIGTAIGMLVLQLAARRAAGRVPSPGSDDDTPLSSLR